MAKTSKYRNSTIQARENAQKYNQKVYSYSGNNREELIKEYKRLAKVADQRLVRLEAYKHDKGFENVQKFAYNKAMYAIKSFAGDKAKRFNLKISEDVTVKQIRKRLNDVLTFLNSPTSTKQGILKSYKKRADTLSKTFGASWTWEELTQIAQSGIFDKTGFGYKTMLTIMARYDTMNNKKAINQVNAIIKQHNKAYNKRVPLVRDGTSNFDIQEYIFDLVKNGKMGQDEFI